jgi:hypothetical protein
MSRHSLNACSYLALLYFENKQQQHDVDAVRAYVPLPVIAVPIAFANVLWSSATSTLRTFTFLSTPLAPAAKRWWMLQ